MKSAGKGTFQKTKPTKSKRVRRSGVRIVATPPMPVMNNRKNFVIDLDQCICDVAINGKTATSVSAILSAKEVKGAREWVNRLSSQGHFICFFSNRQETFRTATTEWLKDHGFKYDSLIMGKPYADNYHYIDDRHVQATTFRGRYAPLVRKEHPIQVFE